jgi:hypothetical protein
MEDKLLHDGLNALYRFYNSKVILDSTTAGTADTLFGSPVLYKLEHSPSQQKGTVNRSRTAITWEISSR